MSATTSFSKRPATLTSRRSDRVARAASQGVSLAQENKEELEVVKEDVAVLQEGAGTSGGGGLGDIVTIPAGGPRIPHRAFGQGSQGVIGGTDYYFCLGMVTKMAGQAPFTALLDLNIATGQRFVYDMTLALGATYNLEHSVLVQNQYLVPTPSEPFLTGAFMAVPILDMVGSGVGFAVSDALAFDVWEDMFGSQGVVGADNAVYFLPNGAPVVMRIDPDPAVLSITFISIPDELEPSFRGGGALHPPTGHIIAFPTGGTTERILAIDTDPLSVGYGTASWVLGTTVIHDETGFVLNVLGAAETAMVVVDSLTESTAGLFSGVVWNPTDEVMVGVPSTYMHDFAMLRYDPVGGSVLYRYPQLVSFHADTAGLARWRSGMFNPDRGSVVLLPDDHPQVVEVRGSGVDSVPIEQAVLLTLPRQPDAGGRQFEGSAYLGGTLHLFPFNAISTRVLQNPSDLDPAATDVISFYGQR